MSTTECGNKANTLFTFHAKLMNFAHAGLLCIHCMRIMPLHYNCLMPVLTFWYICVALVLVKVTFSIKEWKMKQCNKEDKGHVLFLFYHGILIYSSYGFCQLSSCRRFLKMVSGLWIWKLMFLSGVRSCWNPKGSFWTHADAIF